MNENKSTCKNHIKGIVCDVKNCEHHGEGNCCTAQSIAVGPCNACSSSETVCATFRPKENN